MLVDSIPGLVALLTADGQLQFVNRQILQYTGRTLEELKHWGKDDTVYPEDLPHVIDVFTRSIGSGTPYEIVQRLRRSDGVYRWFQNNGFPLRDSSDDIVRWCVLLTDIDERKRAEDALRKSERQFRLLVETIPALVWCASAEGELDYLNQRAVEYSATPRRAWPVGGGSNSSIPIGGTRPCDGGCIRPQPARGKTMSTSSGAQTVSIDGFTPLASLSMMRTGGLCIEYGQIVDIDDQKRAEAGLRQATVVSPKRSD